MESTSVIQQKASQRLTPHMAMKFNREPPKYLADMNRIHLLVSTKGSLIKIQTQRKRGLFSSQNPDPLQTTICLSHLEKKTCSGINALQSQQVKFSILSKWKNLGSLPWTKRVVNRIPEVTLSFNDPLNAALKQMEGTKTRAPGPG